MHKSLYASGFLYHSPSQQILLQQDKSDPKSSSWQLLGGGCKEKEEPQKAFQCVAKKLLGLKLKLGDILPIYFYPTKGEYQEHYVFFSKISRLKKFPAKKGLEFGWFTFKQIQKLPISKQAKQDLTIGHRVIDALERKRLGQKSL